MAARFRSPKSEEEETSLLSEATPIATQYNTKWNRKVFEEWQKRPQNKSAMLELSCWSGRYEMPRCSRSDHCTRAYVAKHAKLLVGQVRL